MYAMVFHKLLNLLVTLIKLLFYIICNNVPNLRGKGVSGTSLGEGVVITGGTEKIVAGVTTSNESAVR